MLMPIIVYCDGEVSLLRNRSDVSAIEPIDVQSGIYKFWDAEGCPLTASVRGCHEYSILGRLLPFFKVIDQANAVISFSKEHGSQPDMEGLSELLTKDLDYDAERLITLIISRKSCRSTTLK